MPPVGHPGVKSNGKLPAGPVPKSGVGVRVKELSEKAPPNPLTLLDGEPMVGKILEGIRLAGGVGQEDEFLLSYIGYTSRLLAWPLGLIFRGTSTSGKNALQEMPLKMMPDEEYHVITSLTREALYYMGAGGELKHKILVCGERKHDDSAEGRDATAAVRQMLTQGYITKRSVKDGVGVELRAEGPVAYSETTTKKTVFTEDLSRMLAVKTDESEAQTRAIITSQADRAVNGRKTDAHPLLAEHQEFQRSLTMYAVKVPFAPVLAGRMPVHLLECRRRFGQMLSVVEAVTVLHQHVRKVSDDGMLVATPTDYAVARRALTGPFGSALGGDYRKWAGILDELADEFTSTQADKVLDAKSRKVLRDRLAKMHSVGLIAEVRKGSGTTPAVWRKTGRSPEDLILPPVSSVE